MDSVKEMSNDTRVLSYVLTLAQSETDPLLRAHNFDLIEKAKLLAQRDLMQAKIDSMTATPTLKAVQGEADAR